MKKIQLLLIFFITMLTAYSQNSHIDISGNWCEFDKFLPYIQTSEPKIKEGEVKIFRQELDLPAGKYTVEFLYDKYIDNIGGQAIMHNYDDFSGFSINGVVKPMHFDSIPNSKNEYSANCNFVLSDNENHVKFELALSATRPLQTILKGNGNWPVSNHFYGIAHDFENTTTALIHGIPFVLSGSLVSQNLRPHHPGFPFLSGSLSSLLNPKSQEQEEWDDGINIKLDNVKSGTVHFLGMVQQYDVANGSWYSPKGDNSFSHFVGDTTGVVSLSFTNEEKLDIPLIYGFNFWYSWPWDIMWYSEFFPQPNDGENFDADLFCGENKYRDIIKNGVKLTDGFRIIGALSNKARYIFSLDLDGRAINKIEIKGNDEMKGIPIISAITFETKSPQQSVNLQALPSISRTKKNQNLVTADYVENQKFLPGVDSIMHVLYTFVDEHPKMEKPDIPNNYFGPKYDFKGPQEAFYATSYLYKNGLGCASFIGDNGCGCSSPTARMLLAHYTMGMGVWRRISPLWKNMDNWINLYHTRSPGELGGLGSAWSRGIGELMRESMALGYDKFINSYTNWLDSCLFNDGTPPHWIRIAGKGKSSSGYSSRQVGNILEQGNRENDGHGICMWGRYMIYHWQGRPVEWNKEHWGATKAAVDWIQWQLDTDTIFPGKRKDILFSENECAHNAYDIYTSYNCLHGLKLSIRMAEQLGKTKEVKEWTTLYKRLQKGILDNLVDSSDFGPIWHTEKRSDWQDNAHKLVHLQLATEGDTYTPLQDYANMGKIEKSFIDIDINSYKFLMKEKNYNCLRMYGYGQGMMAQSALLLDQMEDATQFINKMVTYAYLPKFEGWMAPEGIIVHKSGKYYLPVNAYGGQDSHLADSQKALRLMLGIDDNKPEHLRIVPRFPKEWTSMAIDDYPVLTGVKRQKCGYSYQRGDNTQSFRIWFDEPVNDFSIRLGPLPKNKTVNKVTNKGKDTGFRLLDSGDCRWVWIENLSGKENNVTISFK